ncbi:Exostosin-1c, partial [Xenoophorus captivus]
VPSTVRAVPNKRVLELRQRTQMLWDAYFSSDRVFSHLSRNKYMWNSLPGGLLVLPEYSTHLAHFPFYYLGLGVSPGHEFTAVIHAVSPLVSQSQPIMKLLQVVSKSKYCSQVKKPTSKSPFKLDVVFSASGEPTDMILVSVQSLNWATGSVAQ